MSKGRVSKGRVPTPPGHDHVRFCLLTEPWIPCERQGGTLVHLGLEEVLVEAHTLAAVHDSSPLVTATIHRLLLAVLHRAFGPATLAEWCVLWNAPAFDAAALRAYLRPLLDRFDLFHPERPFLQVAGLRELLTAESKAPAATPAARLAPERSQHSAAAHLYAPLPAGAMPPITPAEAARALLAFQGFAAGGRIQNEAASRKSGPLRGGAVVIVEHETLRTTLLLNLVASPPVPNDLPLWERPHATARTSRAPLGPVDALVWASRRVQLFPVRDANGALVVREVITAAGEDLDTLHPDRMTAWVKREAPEPVPVRIDAVRATWRDAGALFDPETGAGAFRRPAACEQLDELVTFGDLPAFTNLRVALHGLVTNKAAIRDWRTDRLPLPSSLLASRARVEVLRSALADAEGVADALRQRVLFALGLHLVGSSKDAIGSLRESLGTILAFWEALGREFPAWLDALGAAPADALEASRWAWRGLVRQAAQDGVLRAVQDVGLSGRAMRASAAAERALVSALDELLPVPEGVVPAALALPAHAPPGWRDATGFIPALDKLVKDKALGALAALRKSFVDSRGMAPEAATYVRPLLPANASRRECEVYYLVAALRAEHRDAAPGVSLGHALRRVRDAAAAGPATEARLEALLATHADDVGEVVRTVLPLVYARTALDWELLLHDLLFWTRRDRMIQRRLAREFWEETPSSPPLTPEAP